MRDIMSDSGGFSSIRVSGIGGSEHNYIWTSEKINKLIDDINNGNEDIRKLTNSPFKDNDMNLKREKLPFEYTPEEISELQKCKSSLLYFVLNYCIIQTHSGRNVVKDAGGLRDYQEQILNTFNNNKLNILMASRQTGKCLMFDSILNIRIKLNYESYIYETMPFFELYYKILRSQRKLTIFEKLKYKLYKFYIRTKLPILCKLIQYMLLKIVQAIEYIEYFNLILDESNIDYKLIDTVFAENYEILTDTGYSTISNLHKTQPYKVFHLRTDNGKYLKCADNHIVFNHLMEEVYVKNLTNDSHIMTDEGPSRVNNISSSSTKISMYDIAISDSNHRYYSSGILSHNTVTSALYILWFLLFHPEKTALCVADNFTTTKELIDKFKISLEGLPFFLKPGIETINSSTIKFDSKSRLVGRTTTKKSGIGLTVNLLYVDEFAHINESNLDEFYRAIFPTVTADPDGKIILTSTPNGKNKFWEIWKSAVDGQSGYVPLRVDWWQVAGRGDDWKKQVIADLGSEEDFNQEYGLQFFSSDKLLLNSRDLKRLEFIKAKYEQTNLILNESLIHVNEYLFFHKKYSTRTVDDWKKDKANYVFSIDTADGIGSDYSVLNIYKAICMPISELYKKREIIKNEMDSVSLVQIGYIRSNQLDIGQFSTACEHIIYNVFNSEQTRIVIELNHKGDIVLDHLKQNDNYWPGQIVHTKHTQAAVQLKPGLRLGLSNKIKYCEKFKYLIMTGKIIPNDEYTVIELQSFGKSKGGIYRGQNGNDDLAMTSVNMSSIFESSQFWDIAINTFENQSPEYVKDLEEKILNIHVGAGRKSGYNFDDIKKMNDTGSGSKHNELNIKPDVFNIDSLNHMTQLKNKFFKS